MDDKNFVGLTELEVVKLINKKKARYCAMALSDIEELVLDEDTFQKVRKVVLDNMNAFTRGMFTVVGISIEGINEP
jgi:hypothetical protein